jgi:hypothetical protein
VKLGQIKEILAGIYVLGRPRKFFPAGPGQPSLARLASRPVVTPAGPLLFAPGWAGRQHRPDWAGAISRLGRHSLTGWAGIPLPRWAGRPSAPGRSLPRPSRHPASAPGWAASAHPGWARISFPGWAATLAPVLAGPSPVQHPAGPDQEDLAWPGFLPRPLCVNPDWAGFSVFWLGQAGDSLAQAGLLPWEARFHLSGLT